MVDTNVYDATQIGNCVESRICYCLYNRVKCLLCLISINCPFFYVGLELVLRDLYD